MVVLLVRDIVGAFFLYQAKYQESLLGSLYMSQRYTTHAVTLNMCKLTILIDVDMVRPVTALLLAALSFSGKKSTILVLSVACDGIVRASCTW